MNRRNKTKAPPSTSTKPPQPVKQAASAKATPPPKPAPPPPAPKPTPSSRLRQEWQSFEIWLSARRADRDKRVSERIKELMSQKAKNRSQRQAVPTSNQDIGRFEAGLNQELAEQARLEWLDRLSKAGLNEEDWLDITPAEMQAVEAAFTPPEMPDSVDPGAIPHQTTHNHTFSAPYDDPPLAPSASGGWNRTPSSAAKAAPGRPIAQPAPVRSASSTNGWGSKVETPASRQPVSESPWDMFMKAPKMSQSASMSSEASVPESPWNIFASKSASPPSQTFSTGKLPTAENLWDMHMNRTASFSQPTSPPTSIPSMESLWDAQKSKKAAFEQPSSPPESYWGTKAVNQNVNSSSSYFSPPTSENLWEMRGSTKPAASQPQPQTPVPPISYNSSLTYVYLSPVSVEIGDGEAPLLDLPEKTAETAIKQFHQTAAQADIELRRKLVSDKLEDEDRDKLLEEHLNTMEQRSRDIVDEWRQVCKAEKQKRIAEVEKQKRLADLEKQKRLAEFEKQKRLAELNKGATNGTRRVGTPSKLNSPIVKPPEPQGKKAQGKKAAEPTKKHQATVEDADSDSQDSGPTAPPPISISKHNAGKQVNRDESQPGKAPAKSVPNNSVPNPWGKSKSTASPSPSPTPWGRTSSDQKSQDSNGKNPFSGPSAAKSPLSSSWGDMFSGRHVAEKEQTFRFDEEEEEEEEEEEGEEEEEEEDEDTPSLWGKASREGARGATTAWNAAMSAISGERASTPVARPPTRPRDQSFSFMGRPDSAWGSEDSFSRSKSRGPPMDDRANGQTDPRFATWVPNRSVDHDHDVDDPVKKMADLALQNLVENAQPEEESEPTDLYNAMSMYTKAVASSGRKKGNAASRR